MADKTARQDDPFGLQKLVSAERRPRMSIRVVIADDHPVVRDGLRLAIERRGKEVVIAAEAADGMEVLRIAGTKPPDVFILDITMPKMNGIETARELLLRLPGAKIIMLSLHDTRAMVEESLSLGARGFLTKETATRNVVDAIMEVHAGGFYLSPAITHYVVESSLKKKTGSRRRGATAFALTGQERKVLQFIAEGRSSKEVASELGLSFSTVHTHRSHLMAKLRLHNQSDLVHYAIKAGIAKL
jgi:DNA-binding NarL/FixJ family response regulator